MEEGTESQWNSCVEGTEALLRGRRRIGRRRRSVDADLERPDQSECVSAPASSQTEQCWDESYCTAIAVKHKQLNFDMWNIYYKQKTI